MNLRQMAAVLFLSLPFPAMAADGPGRMDAILDRHARHGIVSPATAEAELAAAVDRPGRSASEQSRYYFSLGRYAAAAGHADVVRNATAELERLARSGRCEPCRSQALLIEGLVASRAKRNDASRKVLGQLTRKMPEEPVTRLYAHLFRASVFESWGEYDASIAAAVEASRLAESLHRPTDHIRALNRMVLANIGRRDLVRAEALANEGYALAEHIGDIEQMVFLRGNQGFIHSIRGEGAKQFQALNDVLRITRDRPALRDATLVTQVNLSDYHLNQGEYRRAIEHALQGEKLARELENPVAGAVAKMNRAGALARLGQVPEAVTLLREAIATGEKADAKTYVLTMYSTLARIYEEAGRPDDSLQTMKKVLELTTALTRSQREDAVLELQEKYSAERKSREIERLSLENARRKAEVDARAWQQRMWATFAALLLLAAGMLVQWLRSVRRRNRSLEADNAVLARQSSRDSLTGAFNRRYCEQLMGQQEATLNGRSRARDYRACVGLMLLDVDFLKSINEAHGHAVGDAVLVEMSRRLQGLIREKDALVRWSGEQFVLVLPGTPGAGLAVVAERVLGAVCREPVDVDGLSIPVTMSAGGLAWPAFPGHDWEDALHVAGLALHLSKSRGRNRATCLLEISPEADHERIHADLSRAEALGDIRLETVVGPGTPAAARTAEPALEVPA